MTIKKKMLSSLLALTTVLSLGNVADIKAAEDSKVLYEYVQKEDGSYGYDKNKPVKYYQGSEETVKIPKDFKQDKEEFKSAWVSTIFNLNIPTPKDEEDFKKLYMERLNTMYEWNMNAMIFQVRPLLDAYYQSEINPTSQYLSGKQGQDVNWSIDPLTWMIEQTHEKGMEYHAWFNPYRITNSKPMDLVKGLTEEEFNNMSVEAYLNLLVEKEVLSKDNFGVKNPHLVMKDISGKLLLNPGEPEVVEYFTSSIKEVVENYDVDAIHFDDYFYPYSMNPNVEKDRPNYDLITEQDRASFEKYGIAKGYKDDQEGLDDWRRDNVTKMVSEISKMIKAHNKVSGKSVQFGISPFGIYKHKKIHGEGTNTPVGSSESYSGSAGYADTVKWMEKGLVDYVVPQIYWAFTTGAAPYGEIARWWSEVGEKTNTHVYVGHPNYKLTTMWLKAPEFLNPEEINNQVKFNQNLKGIKGSSIFSYEHLNKVDPDAEASDDFSKLKYQGLNGSIDILKNDSFSSKSLTPAKPHLSPKTEVQLEKVVLDSENGKLSWTEEKNKNSRFYVIYEGNKSLSLEELTSDANNILDKVKFNGKGNYEYEIEYNSNKQYAVSVLDRAFVETKASLAKPILEEGQDETKNYNVKSYVNIRSSKDVSSEKLGNLNKGDKVKGIIKGAWLEFDYKGEKAYISKNFITEKELPVEKKTGYKVKSYVNIRSGKSTSSKVLANFKKGDLLEGTIKGAWLEFDYKGGKAYISKNFVEETNVYTVKSYVNIRSGRNTKSKILGNFRKGDLLEGTIKGAWLELDYKGGKAYISKNFVK